MRLLDLIEQKHAMRMLIDAVGQEAALIEADIAGRRADQARDRMALHIFAHVEAQKLNTHERCELARNFGLADAGGAGEEIAADRLFRLAQAGTRKLDRGRQLLDRGILAEHDALQIGADVLEHADIGFRNRLGRDARDLGDHRLDLFDANHLAPLALRQKHLRGTCLIDHVDRLVRQLTVVNVFR